MRTLLPVRLLSAGALAGLAACLSACIVPPSLYERASYAPPSWQEQGRYRPAGADSPGSAPANTPAAEAPSPASLADPHAPQDGAAPPVAQPPLYAWDGGVVDGAPQGRVEEEQGSPRGLEQPPAGRAHIIELYQQALDERDALATEVEVLRKGLEETRALLDSKTEEALALSSQVATLEASHAGLLRDNQDFAARLVQAQIRRLEAEKLLLETRIEIQRARTEPAVTAEAGLARKEEH